MTMINTKSKFFKLPKIQRMIKNKHILNQTNDNHNRLSNLGKAIVERTEDALLLLELLEEGYK